MTVSEARPRSPSTWIWGRQEALVAILALAGILVHLILRYVTGVADSRVANLPVLLALFVGGFPLVVRLLWRGLHGGFGADHLAGISIVASAMLGEYLAGAIVVLMLSGGETASSGFVKKPVSACADRSGNRMS